MDSIPNLPETFIPMEDGYYTILGLTPDRDIRSTRDLNNPGLRSLLIEISAFELSYFLEEIESLQLPDQGELFTEFSKTLWQRQLELVGNNGQPFHPLELKLSRPIIFERIYDKFPEEEKDVEYLRLYMRVNYNVHLVEITDVNIAEGYTPDSDLSPFGDENLDEQNAHILTSLELPTTFPKEELPDYNNIEFLVNIIKNHISIKLKEIPSEDIIIGISGKLITSKKVTLSLLRRTLNTLNKVRVVRIKGRSMWLHRSEHYVLIQSKSLDQVFPMRRNNLERTPPCPPRIRDSPTASGRSRTLKPWFQE